MNDEIFLMKRYLRHDATVPNEVHIINKISDSSITPRLIEHFPEGGDYIVVTEFLNCPWKDYAYFIDETISEITIKRHMRRVLEITEQLFGLGLYNINYQLSNIMVNSETDEIKFIDFKDYIINTFSKNPRLCWEVPSELLSSPQAAKGECFDVKANMTFTFGLVLHSIIEQEFLFETVDEIINKYEITFDRCSKDARSLIRKCLDKDEINRVRYEAIKNEPWFAGKSLRNKYEVLETVSNCSSRRKLFKVSLNHEVYLMKVYQDNMDRVPQHVSVSEFIDDQSVTPRIIEHFPDGTDYVVIMEFLDSPWTDYLAFTENCHEERTIKILMLQLLETTEKLFNLGLYNMNFKQSHLMINPDTEELRFIDFDACIVGEPNDDPYSDSQFSVAKILASPQLCQKKMYNVKANMVFTFGLILNYSVEQTLLFKTPHEIINKYTMRFVRSSLELQTLIRKCVLKNESERIPYEDIKNDPWFDDVDEALELNLVKLESDLGKKYEVLEIFVDCEEGKVFKVSCEGNIYLKKVFMNYSNRIPREVTYLKYINDTSITPRLFEHFLEGNDYVVIIEFLEEPWMNYFKYAENWILEDVARRQMLQILKTTEYLFTLGLYNIDFKPENIMINSETEEIKFIDFNDYLFDAVSWDPISHLKYGTEIFTSPQWCRDKTYNVKANMVFTFGTVLFSLIEPEYAFINTEEILNKYDLDFVNSSIKLQTLLRKCLIKNESERIKFEDIKNDPWFHESYQLDVDMRFLKNSKMSSQYKILNMITSDAETKVLKVSRNNKMYLIKMYMNHSKRVPFEAEAIELVNNPSITPKLIEHFPEEENYFIVMEFLDRPWMNYRQFIAKFRYEHAIQRHMRTVLAFQEHLFSLGLYNIDFNTYNVMINSETEEIRFIDFRSYIFDAVSEDPILTVKIGTETLSSPQWCKDEAYSVKANMSFTFGVILYFLYERKQMFKTMTEIICKTDLEFKNSPKLVQRLIERCVVKEESGRIKFEDIKNDPWFGDNLDDYMNSNDEVFNEHFISEVECL